MNKNKKISILDNIDIEGKYDVVKLSDTCKEIFEIEGIDLNKEYEKKMPLLRNLSSSKKKILKRR